MDEAKVKVRFGPDGRPVGAVAELRVDRPVADVWAVLADLQRFAERLPMVHRARRDGDRVTFDLKFKIGFFSVGFQFKAEATYEAEKWLELRWYEGEPRDVRLRFDLKPEDEGKACLVEGHGEFDVQSLGWLVKYFLRHHPEIQYGIFPGIALALVDTLRKSF
jgi:hypothetical protein